MLYVDKDGWQNADDPAIHKVFRGRRSAHLMADTTKELVEYAAKLGMKVYWIQKRHTPEEHFDITGVFLDRVMRDKKVIKLDRRQFIDYLKSRRAVISPE